MRPGKPRAQDKRHSVQQSRIVEARAQFAPRIVRRHGVIRKPEPAASQVSLAVGRGVEPLRLYCRIGCGADHGATDRHSVAITRFDSAAIALPGKARSDIVAERGAVGGKPVVGEGKRGCKIGWTRNAAAVDADLEGCRFCRLPILALNSNWYRLRPAQNHKPYPA